MGNFGKNKTPLCQLKVLYNYKLLMDLLDVHYYLAVLYDECKRRWNTHDYIIYHPTGPFDGHVWPMCLKHSKQHVDVFN